MKSPVRRISEAVLALCAWSGLVLVVAHSVGNRPFPAALAGASELLFYFTIETALLTALLFTAKSLAYARSDSAVVRLRWTDDPRFEGAVTVYLAVTGIVFLVLLRGFYVSSSPIYVVANIFLHYVTPLLGLVYWAVFCSAKPLRLVNALAWLAFPLAYLVLSLARGAFLSRYPYPFLDVTALGLGPVLGISAGLGVFFFALGALLVFVSSRRRRSADVR